ncbi:MAG: DUF2164 family protein [Alteromonadaceae bacterium]|nr:DUF2164 family protein [Alteromonadaceae bacterium]
MIRFSESQKHTLVTKLQRYFEDELDSEIGQFDAEFLLDFISKEMGTYYYNQGVKDSQAVLASRIEDVTEAIFELEKIES